MTDTWRRACTETGNCLEVDIRLDGTVAIRNSRAADIEVTATHEEFGAFVKFVRDSYEPARHRPLTDEPCGVIPTPAGRELVNAYRAHRTRQKPRGSETT